MSRLIDADVLIKLFPDNGEGSWTYNVTAQSYIDAMPTIEERKKGKWEEAIDLMMEQAERGLEER